MAGTQTVLMLQGLVLATSLTCAVFVASVPRQDTEADRVALRYFLGHFALMFAAIAIYYVQFLPVPDYFLVLAYFSNGTLALLAIYCLWYGVRWKQGSAPTRRHDALFTSNALITTVLVFYLDVGHGIAMPILRAGFYGNMVIILLATWGALDKEAHPGMRMLRHALLAMILLQLTTAGLNLYYPGDLLYQHMLAMLQVVSLICVLGGVYSLYLYSAVERHRQDSITDALTGLYNRRYLDDRLRAETTRAQRSGKPLSLITCDIDHFKQINDTHGHAVGDQALVAIAEVLRKAARQSDVVARAGGEEFAVLAPDTALDNAARLAERLRQQVGDCRSVVADGPLSLSASFGVAQLSDTADRLLEAADSALYRAKEEGRNRVACADPAAVRA